MLATGTLEEQGFHVLDSGLKAPVGDKDAHIWFVIASKKQAYIYRRAADSALVLIAHAHDNGDQMQSVDERTVSSQSIRAHLKHDESWYFDTAFIHRLVEWLEIAGKEKAFDQLVLVAAPDTLESIRSGLSDNLQGRICAEVDKELTGMSVLELQERLSDINGSP